MFLVVAVGVVLRRYRFLDEGFIDAANSLVFYILLPALLFHEIGTTDFRQAFSGPLVAGGYVATIATFLLAFLLSRVLGLGPSETGAFVQGSFRANLAYVGLPIVFNAVGPAGLRKAGIFLGLIVPLLNGLSIVALMTPHGAEREEGIATTASRIARQIVTNPIILACLAGIAWSVLKLPLPGMVDRTFRLLTPTTLPLSLLCLGGSFSFERARKGFAVAAVAAFLKGCRPDGDRDRPLPVDGAFGGGHADRGDHARVPHRGGHLRDGGAPSGRHGPCRDDRHRLDRGLRRHHNRMVVPPQGHGLVALRKRSGAGRATARPRCGQAVSRCVTGGATVSPAPLF